MAVLHIGTSEENLKLFTVGRRSLLIIPCDRLMGVQFERGKDKVAMWMSDDSSLDSRRGAVFKVYDSNVGNLHQVVDLDYSVNEKVIPSTQLLGMSIDDFKKAWDEMHGTTCSWESNPESHYMIIRRDREAEAGYDSMVDPLLLSDKDANVDTVKAADGTEYDISYEVTSTHISNAAANADDDN